MGNDPIQTRTQSLLDVQTKLEGHEAQFELVQQSLGGMRKTMEGLQKLVENLAVQIHNNPKRPLEGPSFSFPESEDTSEPESGIKPDHQLFESGFKGGGENGSKGGGPNLNSHIHPNHFDGAVMAMPKVRIPAFDGSEDPRSWLTQADLYFRVHRTQPAMKIMLAQMCMSGTALTWFARLFRDDPQLSWEVFRLKMQQRFSERRVQNAYEELSTLRQTGTVDEYIEAFEKVTAFIPKSSEDQFLGHFIGGLKEVIRPWVRTLRPRTCDDAMEFARDVELSCGLQGNRTFGKEKGGSSVGMIDSHVTSHTWKPTLPKPPTNPTRPDYKPGSLKTHDTHIDRPTPPFQTPNPNRNRIRSNLSAKELEERRRKGLCFKCALPYSPQHRCKIGELRLTVTENDLFFESDASFLESEVSAITNELETDGECAVLEFLSAGSEPRSSPHTLKLTGAILGIPVVLLVDSGATHNFISPKLVHSLGLSTEFINPLSIRLGDGHNVFVQEQCLVCIKLGSGMFTLTALLFELGHLDMVLGMAWLQPLGDVLHNWDQRWMKFVYEGEAIELQGTRGTQSELTALQVWLGGESLAMTVVGSAGSTIDTDSSLSSVQMNDLQHLLFQNREVFEPLTGLPPRRKHDHAITLFPGQGAVSVRPCRYPHIQKEEIERQVAELLGIGLIRPSQSAFSSPVLLVKKKDASWRMCIDFRALNKVTVPDKFPIPVVDELLDELNGAK
ncbi:uncharacterized protein [Euphorbia lathyris]|uniref:uncharacterized protein n=1 Tax=Euphorbia lathyris TaxID=212925 RepID=UPI00331441F5